MKLLKRNLSPVWYCRYINTREPGDVAVPGVAIVGYTVVGDDEENENRIIDENGNETGEIILNYARAKKLMASVSTASGDVGREMFGNLENYDKIIITDWMDCPIDENTVLFVDKEPEYAEVTNLEYQEATALYGNPKITEKHFVMPLYDYVVRRVAKSRNYIGYAVGRVTTS